MDNVPGNRLVLEIVLVEVLHSNGVARTSNPAVKATCS